MSGQTNLYKGAKSELIVEMKLLEAGFFTFTPSYGQQSPMDIIAYKNGDIKLVQVKTGSLQGNSYVSRKTGERVYAKKRTVRVTLSPGGNVIGQTGKKKYNYEQFLKTKREYDVLAIVFDNRVAWVDDPAKFNGKTQYQIPLFKGKYSYEGTKFFHEYENPDWLKV